MSKSLNKIQLIGRVGKISDLKRSKADKPYIQISMVTKDGTGSWSKDNWHSITFFGKMAENVAQYLTVGQEVYVEGSLEYSEYEVVPGKKVKQSQIKGFQMIFLGKKPEGAGGGQDDSEPPW